MRAKRPPEGHPPLNSAVFSPSGCFSPVTRRIHKASISGIFSAQLNVCKVFIFILRHNKNQKENVSFIKVSLRSSSMMICEKRNDCRYLWNIVGTLLRTQPASVFELNVPRAIRKSFVSTVFVIKYADDASYLFVILLSKLKETTAHPDCSSRNKITKTMQNHDAMSMRHPSRGRFARRLLRSSKNSLTLYSYLVTAERADKYL